MQPIFAAIERMVAPWKSCCASCSTTIRTACFCTSGGYFLVLCMTRSSHELEPPTIPGQFNSALELQPITFLTTTKALP